ncbi:MAG: ATP-binding protein [Lachnospiraceae bacterium]|nr:ATP-binding protein [Lachnospiraceae bacterium]
MTFSSSAIETAAVCSSAFHAGRPLSQKVYLELGVPSENDTTADAERLLSALRPEFPEVSLPYYVLKRDYPAFRKENWRVTASVVFTGNNWQISSIEAGNTTDFHYGLAADLGSTTVVMSLMNLNTGELLAEEGCFNRQISFGTDILTRIFYTQSGDLQKKELQTATTDTFVELMDRLREKTGVDVSKCPVLVVGGNTTMVHFLLGIDAFPVFMAPFAPVFHSGGFIHGPELSLPFDGLVHCIPSAANYLGGDIVSGLLAAGIVKNKEISLYIDIGTNGEMAVGNSEFLVAGAGAAGPALEGGISKYGMRAEAGAVDTVSIEDGRFTFTTIEHTSVKGICGSGIVDLLAELLLNGWMDLRGILQEGQSDRIIEKDGELVLVYGQDNETIDGEERYFSQSDILNFMDTKAAAATMVDCLLSETGISADEISHIYMAGSFGKYLNLESAITIGLYPDLPRERFICMGNGSLKGACALLADRTLLEQFRQILPNMHYLQFATVEDFVPRMQAAKFFPHTDLEAWPTVKAKLIRRGTLKG